MPHDSDAIAIAQAQDDLARLKREREYGIAHPYAGYCGEDDAREDMIDDLTAWLRDVHGVVTLSHNGGSA